MYRTIADFEKNWTEEGEATLRLLANLTDDSLAQQVTPKGRSLGFLAWHLVLTIGEMMGHAGLPVEGPDAHRPVPSTAAEIKDAYGRTAWALVGKLRQSWSDEMLADQVEMYGEKWERGKALYALILHQAHHRGQMTVLMRQAGLPVPGVYGPAYEEWASFGMPPME
jgi:uncharacterized damage-inducible protein DinB